MIERVKGFGEVTKDANCKFVLREGFFHCLEKVQSGVCCIMTFSESILRFEEDLVPDQELKYSVIDEFFQDF